MAEDEGQHGRVEKDRSDGVEAGDDEQPSNTVNSDHSEDFQASDDEQPSDGVETDRSDGVEADDDKQPSDAVDSDHSEVTEGDGTVQDDSRLRIGRVALTALAISFLHAIVVFGILPFVSGRPAALAIGLGLLPYLLVGGIAGALRGGQSLLETFYGAVFPAVVFSSLYELGRVYAGRPAHIAEAMESTRWVVVLVPILVCVLVALFATWVGERRPLRGDTV